jgi:hypothetical protein
MRRSLPLCLLVFASCAPAQPAFIGGSTTPSNRADVGLGGAVRIATGELRNGGVETTNASSYREAAEATGIVPAAYARYGLPHHLDLGLMAAGTLFRLELRREHVIEEGTTRPTFIYGLAPYAAYIGGRDGEGQGHRLGLEVPLAYAVELGGVYEVWGGARLAIERIHGDFFRTDAGAEVGANGLSLRAGAVLGMALGFRRVHTLIELTASYERFFIEHGGESLDRGGFVLTPSFALRVRI